MILLSQHATWFFSPIYVFAIYFLWLIYSDSFRYQFSLFPLPFFFLLSSRLVRFQSPLFFLISPSLLFCFVFFTFRTPLLPLSPHLLIPILLISLPFFLLSFLPASFVSNLSLSFPPFSFFRCVIASLSPSYRAVPSTHNCRTIIPPGFIVITQVVWEKLEGVCFFRWCV